MKIVLFVFCFVSLSGCTLQFKAKEIEIDGKTPEARVGKVIDKKTDYQLVSINMLEDL